MSEKAKKQFGVWIDTHHATIVGLDSTSGAFTIVGNAKNSGPGPNSSENAANNHEKSLVQKYFKEIARHLLNADEVHITGTGTIQEQFMHYLGETPQYKKTYVSESTSTPMSDERLVEFIQSHFN